MNYHSLMAVVATGCLAAACSDDPRISTPDRNEQYDRAFVREFGVPATDHPWSESTETTLTIKSDEQTPARIYYTHNDQLYLAGDLTLLPGSNKIPFMVPTSVTELLVETASGRYTAPVGSTLNIDAAASKAPQRITVDQPSRMQEKTFMFTRDNLAKAFFTAFPPGKENIYTTQENVSFVGSVGVSGKSDANWFIVPVYWRRGSEETMLGQTPYGISTAEAGSTFPLYLVTADGTAAYDARNISAGSNVRGAQPTESQAYEPTKGGDITIQATGIRVKGEWTPGHTFGSGSVFMGDMNAQMRNLYNCLWDVKADYLDRAYYTTFVWMPKNVTVKYRYLQEGSERTASPCFVGVSHKPHFYGLYQNRFTMADYNRPDFCDVIYMCVPEQTYDKMALHYTTATVGSNLVYTFAAEDLGGSYDWDFNDVVFSATCVTVNNSSIMREFMTRTPDMGAVYPTILPDKADEEFVAPYIYRLEVTPQAAGGTLPVYVVYHGKATKIYNYMKQMMGKDATWNSFADRFSQLYANKGNWTDRSLILGTEVHKWLGASATSRPINAGGPVTHTGRTVRLYVEAGISTGSESSAINQALKDFSIIVDKNNALGIDTSDAFDPSGEGVAMDGYTPFDGVLGEGSYQIGALSEDKSSTAPQMICIADSYWLWPLEEHHITLAYPNFREWVKNPSASWTGNRDRSHVNDRKNPD